MSRSPIEATGINIVKSMKQYGVAESHMDADNVVLIDGDIVMSEELVRDVVCKMTDRPWVLVDSSISEDGDYNVQVSGDRVLVMNKELDHYYGGWRLL